MSSKDMIDIILALLSALVCILLFIFRNMYKIDKKMTVLVTELPIMKQKIEEIDNKAEKSHRRIDNVDRMLDNHELRLSTLEEKK